MPYSSTTATQKSTPTSKNVAVVVAVEEEEDPRVALKGEAHQVGLQAVVLKEAAHLALVPKALERTSKPIPQPTPPSSPQPTLTKPSPKQLLNIFLPPHIWRIPLLRRGLQHSLHRRRPLSPRPNPPLPLRRLSRPIPRSLALFGLRLSVLPSLPLPQRNER
jgi:hypothetical protein